MATAIYLGLLMLSCATSGKVPEDDDTKRNIAGWLLYCLAYDIWTLLK